MQTCVTSPPYWGLRDYGVAGQIGLEQTPEEWLSQLVEVFRLVRDLLADDGTCWVNIGDAYCHGTGADRGPTTTAGAHVPAGWSNRSQPQRIRPTGDIKTKDLVGLPWMLAFALRADGWYLRQDIIWNKPNPMPESVRDRCTKSHEYVFLLSKQDRYYFDQEAILEPVSENTHARLSQDVQKQVGSSRAHAGGKTNGNMKAVGRGLSGSPHGRHVLGEAIPEKERRKLAEAGSGVKNNDSFDKAMAIMPDRRNKRSVWTIPTESFSGAHFATYPQKLVEPCILAGSRPGDIVFDPFFGSGTTGEVAQRLGRQWIGCELNPEYEKLQRQRTAQAGLVL